MAFGDGNNFMYRFSTRIKDMTGTATREILKLTARPEVISFAGGMPAAERLPCELIRGIADELLGGARARELLQYGQTEGLNDLRAELVKYLGTIGLKASAEQLQVLGGGQQGLDLMCKAFLDKGDVVLVEDPTYLAFLQIVKTYEATAVGVSADENGLVLGDLEDKLKKHRPKLLYTVPTFSNPTGKTYAAENRKNIIALCERYGVVVIEDDPYGRLRYDGEEVPTMKSFDTSGTVVYISSFSKTVAPSLRVAFAFGEPSLIRKLSIGKQCADVQSPALCQAIVAEYLRRGHFYPMLEKSIAVYRKRKDAFLAALDAYMPDGVRYTRPNGGLFIWAELPNNIDAAAMLPEAAARNVAYIQGCEFYADGGGRNTMRLNFSNSDEQRIDSGVKILSELIKSKL